MLNPPSIAMRAPDVFASPQCETWSLSGVELVTHAEKICNGAVCTIHNPSDHHMLTWQLVWRADITAMERLCPLHKVAHPDPDDRAFRAESRGETDFTHGCCGCC